MVALTAFDEDYRDASVHVSGVQDGETIDFGYRPISADSHVTEPPECYADYIEPRYRDDVPRLVVGPEGGDMYVVPGMEMQIRVGGISAAGRDPRAMRMNEARFEELHLGGWDGASRIADQDRDGVAGEIVYPSVGMLLCNHPDVDYKAACFAAYNRWLVGFQAGAPGRIYGIGQTAVRSVDETISDLEQIRDTGLYGAMLPCEPGTDFDYDDPQFDPLWEAAVALRLPLSFHILTSSQDVSNLSPARRSRTTGKAQAFQALIRANQDAIGTLLWGRVFERFPDLRVVCVEADAGWAPHFMYRMNHFYNRHRFWSKIEELPKLPSEYFSENVYLTFQDDFIAFHSIDMMNPRRLMWANDFPHSDSTWPWSRQMLAKQTRDLDDERRRWILRDNVAELYGLRPGA